MKFEVMWRAGAVSAVIALAACGGSSGGGGGGGGSGSSFEAINEEGGLPEGYNLVWWDEFETPGLPDSTKWAYDTHANPKGWYNNELQYYSAARTENSRVEDGVLIIEARQESAASLPSNNGQAYTSARLITQGKQTWTYGYFEISAKVPCSKGIWPAIWMLGASAGPWPLIGEIDIMEHVNNESLIHFNVHTDMHNHAEGTQAGTSVSVNVCDGSFHTYHATWTADEILIGMDGRNYLRYNNRGIGTTQWPFDAPQYLLLNVAVGGDWPGSPDGTTVFPARMEIDYVRVYQ